MSKQERKGLVPELRFPEYKDAGEWEEKSLGCVGEIVTGKTPRTSDESLWNGEIQFVTPTDISEEKYQWKTQRSVSGHAVSKVIPKFSTMFTCIASIGKMALSVKPCITNQQINSIVPSKNYHNEFIYYSLLSIVNFIKSTQSNSTLPIINKTDFSKFTIPVPKEFSEQQKIADCLTSIDELVTFETQKLDALKTHKKGLMQQLFPAEGETQPKLRFPEFRDKKDWETKLFGKLFKINSGKGFKASEYSTGGIRLLQIENVGYGKVKWTKNTIYLPKKYVFEYPDLLLQEGDVVLALNRPVTNNELKIARLRELDVPSLLYQRVGKIELLSEGVISDFAFHLSQWFIKDFVVKQSIGSDQPFISVKTLYAQDVTIPSPPEQQKIAACLTSIDELITAQTQKIDALKAHKKGLMQQLFPVMDDA